MRMMLKNKKTALLTILMSMMLLLSGVLVACGNPTASLTIGVDKQVVDIYLGETENNQEKVFVSVLGVSDNAAKNIYISSDNNILNIQSSYVGSGKTQLTLTAIKHGQTTVTVQSLENKSKKTSFVVNVIQPVTKLVEIEQPATDQHYVVRGQRTFLDVNNLVKFEPNETIQKNVQMTVVSNSYTDRIRIEDNYLVVEADTPLDVKNVSIQIASTDRNINTVNIVFDILEPITNDDILLNATMFTNKDLKKEPAIYLAHNEEATSTEIVRIVAPNNGKELSITPVVTDTRYAEIVQTHRSTQGQNTILDVEIRAGSLTGSQSKLYFEISYVGYSYKVSTQSFATTINSFDVISDIYVNDILASQSITYNLYTNYPTVTDGLELKLEAFPTTVENRYKSFYVSTTDYDPENPNSAIKLFVYSSTGTLIPLTETDATGKFKLSNAQRLVVRATPGTSIDTAQILVESVFTAEHYQGTERNKTVIINFNIHEGVNDVSFYGMENPDAPLVYLSSATADTSRVYFVVKPKEADIKTTSFIAEGNFVVKSNTLRAEPDYDERTEHGQVVGKAYSVQIQSLGDFDERSGSLKILFGNGRYISTEVRTIVPFVANDIKISVPTPSQNSSVGYYTTNFNNADFKAAIAVGSSVNFYVNNSGSHFTSSFLFYQALYGTEEYDTIETIEFSDVLFEDKSTIIQSADLTAFSLISAKNIGRVLVRARFSGKNLVQKGLYKVLEDNPQISINYFYIEVYNPIKTYTTDKSVITLYSYESVGFYNGALSADTVKVQINAGTLPSTYNTIVYTDNNLGIGKRVTIQPVIGKPNEFRIFALSTNATEQEDLDVYSDGQIVFTTTEFGKTYYAIVKVTIMRAVKVKGIVLNNVNEDNGIYMDASQSKTMKLDVTVTNEDAFNKNLKYSFEPDFGVSSNILSINANTGVIQLASQSVGGTGYIVIAPQDVFADEGGQPVIKDTLGVVKRIRIVVADGRTRDTSFRITDLNQINDFSAHYTLTTSVNAGPTWLTRNSNKWQSEFTGGLYGADSALSTPHTITITSNNALFNIIGASGIVADLILVGQLTSTTVRGFVANTNYGTISNVVVDTITQNGSYQMSSVENTASNYEYIGGLVGTNGNTGLIINSAFYGSVKGSNYVGGIAGQNIGTITQSKVEFYTYENSATASITATAPGGYAGGLVGVISASTSHITESYAYSYHNKASVVATNAGALVGRMTNTNGVLQIVFARTSAQYFVANELNFNQSYGIKNAYRYYYDPQNPNTSNLVLISPSSTYIMSPKNIYDDNFRNFYTSHNITFGTANSIWAVSTTKNNGYPYLLAIIQESAPSNLSSLSINGLSNVYADNTNNRAIFFMYDKLDSITLTSDEVVALKNLNTISFTKLFNIQDATGLRVESGQGFSTTSNAVVLTNPVKDVNFTVFSKYDYSIKRTYTISIYYATDDFSLIYRGEKLDTNAVINMKRGSAETFTISFQSKRVLVDRPIEFKQNNFGVSFSPSQHVTQSSNVVFSISTSGFENNIVLFAVTLQDPQKPSNNWANQILASMFTKRFSISTFRGAESVDVNVSEIIHMNASDMVSFLVEVVTDDVNVATNHYEKINIVAKDKNGNTHFDAISLPYNALFENGIRYQMIGGVQTEFPDGQAMAQRISATQIEGTSFYKVIYKVRLSIADTFKSYDFNNLELTLHISSEKVAETTKHVQLVLESQHVESIFVTSHVAKTWIPGESGGYVFDPEPNNVVAPGSNALLNISLFPQFASYQYVDITSSVENGFELAFALLQTNPKNSNAYIRMLTGYTAIKNGIRITKSQAETLLGQKDLAKFYVLLTVPQDVKFDTVFTISIKAFNSQNTQLNATTFNIVTRPLVAAQITVNGENELLMARGVGKNNTATVVVTVQYDQVLVGLSISADSKDGEKGEVYGVSLGAMTEVADEKANTRTYTREIIVLETAQFVNTKTPSFFINAVVNRRIGETYEEKTVSAKVTVVDFLLDWPSFQIKTDSTEKHVVETYLGIGKSIEFTYKTTEWDKYTALDPELNEAIEKLEQKVAQFKQYNYFYNEDPSNSGSKYILNYHEGDTPSAKYKNFLNNLYYVNADGSTTKVLAENGSVVSNNIISFEYSGNGISSVLESGKILKVVGLRTGTQRLRLVFNMLTPNNVKKEFTYDFSVVVSVYTNEDKPIQISSEKDFLDIQNQASAEDYILMNDIELTDYTPFDTTKIRSLDGNNKVITIRSFNLQPAQNSSALILALFTNVVSSTTLKNITVNYYHLTPIVVNTALFTNIQFAGFAINNYGVITNSHVLAFKTNSFLPNPPSAVGLSLTYSTGYISSNVTSNVAGFVLNNNSGGFITNSRVGGTEFKVINGTQVQTGTHSLPIFTISAQGNLAGFVHSNTGVISSSFTNKINIINNTSAGRETFTSGFAGYNSGNIALSYSKGAYNTNRPNEIRTTGSGIATSSVAAGFVFDNSGKVSDSYSNIMIKDVAGVSGRYGAGFVYKNSGLVEKAYASSVIENSKTTQMNFSGVDDYGNLLNTVYNGTFINNYYYSASDENSNSGNMEDYYGSGVLKIDSFSNTDIFYGFSFATVNSLDGVWVMTPSKGPDLISANEVAISNRYLVENVEQETFDLPYYDGYAYGSDKNPIIIRTAQEFNNVFGLSTASAIKQYFNLTQKTIYGHYRLVADIDLATLRSDQTNDYKLVSTEMKLTNGAVVDGNGLTLSNLELVSQVDYANKHYGMFSSIEDGSIIKNLNIKLVGVSASNVQNVGAVTGALVDSKIVNIDISSQNSSTPALVLGQNVVGGVVGMVKGNSAIVSLSTTNVMVTADYYNPNITRQAFIRQDTLAKTDNQTLSYAGGIVGVLDLYSQEWFNTVDYSKERMLSFANASALKVKGATQVRGGTVGGVIGYLGINTSVRDAVFEITEAGGQFSQKIISYKYVAGGVVGESYGDITQSVIEHSHNAQMAIEANMATYYNTTSQNVFRGYESLFVPSASNYQPTFVGGFVGQILSGEISNSYAKVNVIAPNALFVGGFAGAIGDFRYISGQPRRIGIVNFEEVYAYGDVASTITPPKDFVSAAAGMVAFIEYIPAETINSDGVPITINFDGANAVTYWNRNWADIQLYAESENVFQLKTQDGIGIAYDFYAYTKIGNKFVDAVQIKTQSQDDETVYLLFTLTRYSSSDAGTAPVNYVANEFKHNGATYKPIASLIGFDSGTTTENSFIKFEKMVALQQIVSVVQDSSFMDVVFRNNNWDQTKWERKSGELLPSIVFTVTSSIFYITKAEDFKYMELYPDKTFIIVGEGQYGSNPMLIDMSEVKEDTFNIKNFRGVLKGYVAPNQENTNERIVPMFGIKNLRIPKSFIQSSNNGAVFSDFIIETSGYSGVGSDNMYEGGILVDSANGTIFRNIILRNNSMRTMSVNAGLLAGSAHNSIFDTIDVEHTLNKHAVEQNIYETENNAPVYSAGMIVGMVSSQRKTTLKDISIKILTSASAEKYGVKVYNNITGEYDKVVNIGGYYGLSEGYVEILSSGANSLNKADNTIISNLGINFISNENINYTLNAGGIGGKSYTAFLNLDYGNQRDADVSIDLEGKFINPTKDSSVVPSVSAGGLFGNVGGQLSVFGATNGNSIISIITPKIKVKNTYSQVEQDKPAHVFVGGLAGYTQGAVNVRNMYVERNFDRFDINEILRDTVVVQGNNDAVYIGGAIAHVAGQLSVNNVIVRGTFRAKLVNKEIGAKAPENYIGGIVAFYSDSSKDGHNSKIQNTTFNGQIITSNAPKVTFGGILARANLTTSTANNPLSITLESNVFGGDVFIDRVENAQIFVGGIVGKASENTNPEIKKVMAVHSNLSFGDIDIDIDIDGNALSQADLMILGGIVGVGDAGLKVAANKSLTTIYSTRTTTIGGNYQHHAIVGNKHYEPQSSVENTYVSALTLSTDTVANSQDSAYPFATNITYQAMLSRLEALSKSLFNNILITTDQNRLLGYKLNPHILTSSTEIGEKINFEAVANPQLNQNLILGNANFRKYILLTDTTLPSGKQYLEYTNEPITLDGINGRFNLGIVGDGAEIVLKNKQGRLFNVVDNRSFVSAMSITLDQIVYPTIYNAQLQVTDPNYEALSNRYIYRYRQGTEFNFNQRMYAPLVAVNEGVVFGSVVSASKAQITDFANPNLHTKIIISNADLVGGLVALNKGYIADSFASVDILNITGKVNDKYSITGGFVALNEGDIETSYSVGIINAPNGYAYAFGSDGLNIRYGNNVYAAASVRNSFTIAQSSKAFKQAEIEQIGTEQKPAITSKLNSFAGVFGSNVDKSSFYDIWATQVASKGSATKFVTNQISTVNSTAPNDWGKEHNFVYNATINFGYPSFGGAYEAEEFLYMRQITAVENEILIPSLGKLGQIKNITHIGKLLDVYLMHDLELTQDMGYVGFDVTEFTNNDLEKIGTWKPFNLYNVNLHGNNHSISGFSVIIGENGQPTAGFFTKVNRSLIENLILADGEVMTFVKDGKASTQSYAVYVGAFAGVLKRSQIINSYNLGVRVTANSLGTVGGFVGIMTDNSEIDNSYNAGSAVVYHSILNSPILEQPTSLAGGFAGHIDNSRITNSVNMGYVHVVGIDEDLSAGGIAGYNNKPNASSNNYNLGVIYAGKTDYTETRKQDLFGEEAPDKVHEIYEGVTNNFPINITAPQLGETTVQKGNGTAQKPYLIYTLADFNLVKGQSNLHWVLMENIFIGELLSHEVYTQFNASIYGNGKLISYIATLANPNDPNEEISSKSFINKINTNAVISNLRVLGAFENATNKVSILAIENNGTITNTNVYGAITNKSVILVKDETLVAGAVVTNKGTIINTNNYATIKAHNGENSNQMLKGIDATNIGGVVGQTYSAIYHSSNFGVLIGGNGGKGFNGRDGDEGDYDYISKMPQDGEMGGDGTHGGSASIIGGIAALSFIDEEEYPITGGNFGIIIGGTGGNGGNGGKGGDGADTSIAFLLELIPTGAAIFFPVGTIAYGVQVIMRHFKSDVKPAGGGGGGGAGGNGGNSIVSDGVGFTQVTKQLGGISANRFSDAIVKNGTPGEGGTGGNGGKGGRGVYSPTDFWSTLLGYFPYSSHGNGGGAGGTGYGGNSVQTITNLVSYYSTTRKIDEFVAMPGEKGKNGDYKRGGGAGGKGSVYGERGNHQESISDCLSNIILSDGVASILIEKLDINDAYIRPLGGQGVKFTYSSADNTVPNSNLIGAKNLYLEYKIDYQTGQKYYEIESWGDLVFANLVNEDRTNIEYRLLDDIQVDVSDLRTIEVLEGNLNGNGKTIKVTGETSQLLLFETVKNSTVKNLTVELNLTSYASVINQLNTVYQNKENSTFTNVSVKGEVECVGYRELFELRYGKHNTNTTIAISYKRDIPFNGNGNSEPYEISESNWNDFVEFANAGSTANFKLTENITSVGIPTLQNNYVIEQFDGTFDGTNKTISFGYNPDPDDNIRKFASFIKINNGIVKNLKFNGVFSTAAVAYENYGTIEKVSTTEDTVIEPSEDMPMNNVAGIVVNNYGLLDQVENNASIKTQFGHAAGIAINNNILNVDNQIVIAQMKNATNKGDVITKSGHAAGITIFNYGLILNPLNSADVTAGDGLKTRDNFEYIVNDKELAFENEHGGHAAGIAVYNGKTTDGAAFYSVDAENNYTFNYGIYDAKNTGKIKAGNGGNATKDNLTGRNGGYAAGIVTFNYMLEQIIDEQAGEITETIKHKGMIFNAQNLGNITAGNGGNARMDESGIYYGNGGNGGNAGAICADLHTTQPEGEFTSNGTIAAGQAGQGRLNGMAGESVAVA